MHRILKWTVPVDDTPHQIGAGKVVLVASQSGRIDEVQVWTEEYESSPRMIDAQVYATGQDFPIFSTPVGSVVVSNGNLVWHVVTHP